MVLRQAGTTELGCWLVSHEASTRSTLYYGSIVLWVWPVPALKEGHVRTHAAAIKKGLYMVLLIRSLKGALYVEKILS